MTGTIHVTFYFKTQPPMSITCEAEQLPRYLEKYIEDCIGYIVWNVS